MFKRKDYMTEKEFLALMCMFGWRARIGLILPSANIVLEPDFYRMAPEGITIHSTRVYLSSGTVAGLLEMEKHTEAAAKLIASTNPDIVAYGCTSGSFVGGAGWDQKIVEELEKATGTKATTTTTACVAALRELNIKKVSIATPYQKEVDVKEEEYFGAAGFEIANIKGLGLSGFQIGMVPPGEVYRFAKDVCTPDSDGLFISCTDFRALEVVEKLERDLGKPVVTANQATMWDVLRKLKIKEPREGFGKLLTLL